jgi:hypothetical protein
MEPKDAYNKKGMDWFIPWLEDASTVLGVSSTHLWLPSLN